MPTAIEIENCRRKRAFNTPDEATLAVRGQASYQCEICGKWHLTTGLAGRIAKLIAGNAVAETRGRDTQGVASNLSRETSL